MLEGAAALLDAGAVLLVFFTFLTFLVGAVVVWVELFCPAGLEAGAWAANVKGVAAGKLDSLRRLIENPNSGAWWLMFFRV